MFRTYSLVALAFVPAVLMGSAGECPAREWVDATGKFRQEADLVDFDDRIAVLKKGSGRLVAVEIEDLSKDDREYLASAEAKETVAKETSDNRTWVLVDGTKIKGRVAKYGKGELSIVRRNDRLFVNDRPAEDLGEVQRAILPPIVAHLSEKPIKNWEEIKSLVVANRGTLTYPVEGVQLQPDNEEPVIVPFFMFNKRDLAVLEPGWQEWLAAQEDEYRQQEQSTMLRSLANEYQKQQKIDHRIQMLRLASEWFDLWEVELIAPNGAVSFVEVPARNSIQAQEMAYKNCPTCEIGATRRVPRRD
jgi:hypothetical protein